MTSAKSIVMHLVDKGVIPEEFEEIAALELHRELSRRARRTAQTLAVMTALHQLAVHSAELQS